ncbi:hypothetical protein GE09DRAFT_1132642 [Coniochaeta sp. 2T2.1]|nr:hypothetical protein GE09DRAFT_1132642 [Coniochaeta sp. 2T2.1]
MSLIARASRSSFAKSTSIALASGQASLKSHGSIQPCRWSSTSPSQQQTAKHVSAIEAAKEKEARSDKPAAVKKKTMAELDEELRLKLEGISGDGGASGVEYENGKASGLKRNVKANMFRVI